MAEIQNFDKDTSSKTPTKIIIAIIVAIVSCIALILSSVGILNYVAESENIPPPIDNDITNDPSMLNDNLPTVEIVHSSGSNIIAEIADDPKEREIGLMNRRELAPNRGMLFVFDEPHITSFWMKNTYIPLDMIFISDDKTIVNVARNAVPLNESITYSSGKEVKYVLEVEGGTFDKNNYSVGDKLEFNL